MIGAIAGILLGLYVTAALIHVTVVIIGAVFSGAASLISGAFSMEGIAVGTAIGLAWYFLRRKNAMNEEQKG